MDYVNFTLHGITDLKEARQKAVVVARRFFGTELSSIDLVAEPAAADPIDRWNVDVTAWGRDVEE